ncbi:MAG: amino acid adenylation domain-containing protein [Phycisphaerales bacterium]|nr:amino acid adenylation domain-containing protein [Phycisphaerales bacterium]
MKQSFNKLEDQVLSYAQNRLWFIYQYDKANSAVYNIPMVWELDKIINIPKLKDALLFVVNQHEILRTVIEQNNEGATYQVVKEVSKDLIQEGYYTTQHDLEEQALSLVNYGFQLDRETPIQIKFFNSKKKTKKTILVIVIHHIAFDGWSAGVLQKDIEKVYQLLLDNQPLAFADRLQYKDYALWQRHFLAGERWNKELQYWQHRLAGYNNSALPTDFARPLQVNYGGYNLTITISNDVTNNLKVVAKELNTSLYSVLLSGYYLFLSAYSNERDIVIGSPFANRHYAGTEEMIGFFVNSLALRMHINFKDSLKSYIEQVHEIVQQGQHNQDIPFEQLVEALAVERDTSRHPIFQIMFGLQDFGGEHDGTLLKPYLANTEYSIPAKFDMTTMIAEGKDGLSISCNYATSLYKRKSVDRFMRTYQFILTQIVKERLSNSLQKIKFVDEQEYKYLVYDYNKTEADYPKDKTIHQLFEEQVARTPNNIAVVFEDKQLTYQELNNKSNQLAHYLHDAYKTKADDIICLLLERSEWMIVAILGVLKSGAAYCPISPEYPEDRIHFILEDTNPKCLIVNIDVVFVNNIQLPIVDLRNEGLLQTLETCTIHNSPLTIINNLAYIIYTSGTTGNPKGVMVEHVNVVRLFKVTEDKFDVTSRDVWSLFHEYFFDFSVWEIWGALVYGGKLWVVPNSCRKDLSIFYYESIVQGVTILNQTPTSFYALTEIIFKEADARANRLPYRRIVFGGEPLNKISVEPFHRAYPSVALVNMYGITETTVHVSYRHLFQSIETPSNIGRIFDDLQGFILDGDRRLLPIGSIGELYIGGDGVARGYFNRPELTAKRFIKNPFQTEDDNKKNRNSRLYKTGDLVRMLPDGNIEYIGRNDFQVKIRGYRVELGEIENKILEFKNNKAINQAVVLVNDKGDNKYLVAYLVASEELKTEELRNYLLSQLPEYMVPTAYVQLDKLPLTVNGKLDRKALLNKDISFSDASIVLPVNELEVQILNIFSELLSIKPTEISTNTSFFKLGGNSILSIRLVRLLNKKFNAQLAVLDIFQYPNVRGLSYRLYFNKNTQEIVVGLNSSSSNKVMYMVHPAASGAEIYYNLAYRLQEHYTCWGVQNYNIIKEDKIDDLSQLANYYLQEIEAITKTAPLILLGWSLGAQIALEMAYQLEQRGFRNILIYGLDTIIFDPIMTSILSKYKTLPEQQQLILLDIAEKHGEVYKEKILDIIPVEEKLSEAPLSGKLQYTRCVLFKAMLSDKYEVSELFNYRLSLPYNNIDKYVPIENIKVIKLQTSHREIVKQLPELVAGILSNE